jgi:hypothetical protein
MRQSYTELPTEKIRPSPTTVLGSSHVVLQPQQLSPVPPQDQEAREEDARRGRELLQWIQECLLEETLPPLTDSLPPRSS